MRDSDDPAETLLFTYTNGPATAVHKNILQNHYLFACKRRNQLANTYVPCTALRQNA